MYKRIEIEAVIDHPVEAVFPYLADPLRWPEFAPAVVHRRQIGGSVPTLGTRWVAVDRIGPFRLHFIDELVAYEENRRVAWASSAPWNAITEYRCAVDGHSTRIRACYEGEVSGWLRVLSWAPSWIIARVLAGDFRRLAVTLDAGQPVFAREPAEA